MLQFSIRQAYAWTDSNRDATVVVIDVLRATTVVATALANDAVRVIPVAAVDEAFALKQKLRSTTLLGGERNNRRVDGFDLGNSPGEYTAERVAGQTIVLTTTNGTRAIELAKGAARLYTAALVNAGAVARRLCSDGNDVVALCAGTEGSFSLEDWVCAGALAYACADCDMRLDEAATNAADLFLETQTILYELIASGEHGRTLVGAGFADDVREAAVLDRYAVVPFLDGDSLKILL